MLFYVQLHYLSFETKLSENGKCMKKRDPKEISKIKQFWAKLTLRFLPKTQKLDRPTPPHHH